VIATAWRRLTGVERFALVVLAALTAGAIAIPLFAHDPLTISDVVGSRLVGPASADAAGHFHLLGTDRVGRDLFTRMMLAGRLSLSVGVAGSILAALLGTVLGAVAAWRGGWMDRLLMGLTDVLLSLPRLVLLLVCASLWKPGTATVVIVLVATGWMGVARMIRGEVLGVRERPFIESANALGLGSWRILFRHALPNALGPAIVATTLGVGNAILLESGLSFLGLGIQPPAPSWGNMIAGGRDLIVTAPWVAIAPGIALALTVLACTLLGDGLRDRLAGDASAIGLRERA
jgi:peptide/nickel transport system permease protein